MPKNRPRARIDGYRGPYSRRMLEEARQELIHIIDNKDTVIWQRIRQKTGIYRNGERDDRGQGFGEASTYFSHADLPQEHLSQEPTVENRSNVEIVQYPPPSATVSHPNISIQRHFSPSDSEAYKGGSLKNFSVIPPYSIPPYDTFMKKTGASLRNLIAL